MILRIHWIWSCIAWDLSLQFFGFPRLYRSRPVVWLIRQGAWAFNFNGFEEFAEHMRGGSQ